MMVKNNYEFNYKYKDPLIIVRSIKPRCTYIDTEVIDLKLQTIDFNKVKQQKEKMLNKNIESLEKMTKGLNKHRRLLKVFKSKVESLLGRSFLFQKKRVISITENNKTRNKFIESDLKRLSGIFKLIENYTTDEIIMVNIIEDMINKWSEWDKATMNNVIGFLERQCNDDLGSYFMRANKKNNNKSNILSESKRTSVVEKHRKYFAVG